MSTLTSAVERLLSGVLGRPTVIERRSGLAGGSINRTERIDTTAGVFVLKSNETAPAGFFRAEAAGLQALRASRTPLAVPQPVAWQDEDPAFLVLEFLPDGRRSDAFDEQLGRGLAALHRSTMPQFGFGEDNFCGATPQRNTWCRHWVEFYGHARLGAQLELAARAGGLSRSEVQRANHMVASLGRWLSEPPDGPALVHGDLWSGNLHTTLSGHPALLDPAVYYGDREVELGMMLLFGGFSEGTFAAYHDAWPLEPDWRERVPIYQLYHLLNHLNLFGRAYHSQVMAIIDRFA